ncbi:MAG: hypothetical protein IJW61_04470 [Clostridia bacterium]|nr:hypothetical protein [Clostridia bacterium]
MKEGRGQVGRWLSFRAAVLSTEKARDIGGEENQADTELSQGDRRL